MSDFIPGETAVLSLRVTSAAGVAVDPGALRLKVKDPAAAVTTYTYGIAAEITRDGVGRYHADIPLPSAGQWAWRWELDAPNAGAIEGLITVKTSLI